MPRPLSQVSVQQSTSERHNSPDAKQPCFRQTPLLHLFEQQSTLFTQDAPRAAHAFAHTPPVQMLLQQSVFALHATPIAEHIGMTAALHFPPVHLPAQQSTSRVHGASFTKQHDCSKHVEVPAPNPQHCPLAPQVSRNGLQKNGWSRQSLACWQSSRQSPNRRRKSSRCSALADSN